MTLNLAAEHGAHVPQRDAGDAHGAVDSSDAVGFAHSGGDVLAKSRSDRLAGAFGDRRRHAVERRRRALLDGRYRRQLFRRRRQRVPHFQVSLVYMRLLFS